MTTEMSEKRKYDVAISFAGEEREWAQRIASALKERGFDVFYDESHRATLWGTNLYEQLARIYEHEAEFCILIVSQHYAEKDWTRHELRAVQARLLRDTGDYLLPLRVDDAVVEGLPANIGYLDLRQVPFESVCDYLVRKLDAKRTASERHGAAASETQIHRELGRAIQAFRRTNLPDDHRTPSAAMKDLGLDRWTYGLADHMHAFVEGVFRGLWGDDDECAAAMDSLASSMAASERSPDELWAVCVILWALRLEYYIDWLTCGFGERYGAIPLPVRIIAISARLLEEPGLSLVRRAELLDQVESILSAAPQMLRTYLVLPAALTYVYAWRSSSFAEEQSEGESSDKQPLEWAHRGYELGVEAVKTIPEDASARLFALNCCAYLAASVGLDGAEEYVKVLREAELRSDAWNYRFSDTIAMFFYSSAKRIVEKSGGPENLGPAAESAIAELLEKAEFYAVRNRPFFGDEEVPMHTLLSHYRQEMLGRSATGE